MTVHSSALSLERGGQWNNSITARRWLWRAASGSLGDPVESENSDERPKMLGGGYNARVGDRSPPSYSDGVRWTPRGSCLQGFAGELLNGVLEPEGSWLEPGGSGGIRRFRWASEDARWASEDARLAALRTLGNRSSPVHGVAEQRAPEGSRVIKLPMNTRGCSLEAIRFRRHTGDAWRIVHRPMVWCLAKP